MAKDSVTPPIPPQTELPSQSHLVEQLQRERKEANQALDELVALSEEMGLYSRQMDCAPPDEKRIKRVSS